ncbi:EpsG family protein [Haemophilus haemoglobinophilus]|nr:EpsG family protein [Canicola haemoglobinophilus]
METYIIYNFILFGTMLFAYCFQIAKYNLSKKILFFISLSIPLFFLILRYDIGTDYQNYIEYFYKIKSGEEVSKEIGYVFINRLVDYFELHTQWIFIIFGIGFIVFSYLALPKEHLALSLFFFITTMYLYEGFSTIRQGLAVAIMAYALKYVHKKEFLKYGLLGLFAISFHTITGLLLLILYPFLTVNLRSWVYISIICILFVLMQYTAIGTLLFHYTGQIIPKYEWYLTSKFSTEAQTSFGLIGPLIKVSIALFIFFFKNKIVTEDKRLNVFFNLYFFYVISYIFHLKISIFGRVEHIFIFSQIMIMTYFIYYFKGYAKLIVMSGLCLFFYLMFIRYIANGTLDVDNDVYINPYQMIIFR